MRGAEAAREVLLTTGVTRRHLEAEGGPLVLRRGKGVEVEDEDGRRYLDGLSGYWTVSVGYGRPEVARAVAEQLELLSYAPLDWRAHEPAVRLARRLLELSPGMSRVFFCAGGSEAVDTALKLSRLVAAREGRRGRGLAFRRGSYHGATLGATSVTGFEALREPFEPLLPGCRAVSQPDCARCPLGLRHPSCGVACAAELEEAAAAEGGLAAVIAEPVCAASRVIVPPPDYWPALRSFCDRSGALLVADEVLTGAGRTGRWSALEHWGVAPDILLLAKGLTGGYAPLGAVLVNARVATAVEDVPFDHGYTFGGHPAACAAALEVLRIIAEERLVENAARVGAFLAEELRSAAGGRGRISGLGLLVSVDLSLAPGERAALRRRLREAGLLALVEEDALALAPPLCVSEGEALTMARIAARALDAPTTTAAGDARG